MIGHQGAIAHDYGRSADHGRDAFAGRVVKLLGFFQHVAPARGVCDDRFAERMFRAHFGGRRGFNHVCFGDSPATE